MLFHESGVRHIARHSWLFGNLAVGGSRCQDEGYATEIVAESRLAHCANLCDTGDFVVSDIPD
jgi:hypothetical protein